MQSLIPYLIFNGNCREAMNFYQNCFGGTLEMMTWGDGPHRESCPDTAKEKIMHGSLTKESFSLLAADKPDGEPTPGDNIQLTIQCESIAEIEGLFKALGAEGKIIMPLEDTFWGARFGVLIDKFGICWKLNCPLEQ